MSDFADYCCELLGSLGPCRARRMFGGHGLSCDGLNVALIIRERLYLKVDSETRDQFADAGGEPFTYTRSGDKVHALGYWTVPSEAMDSARLMAPWARLAMEAALRNPAKPKAEKRPGAPKVAASKAAAPKKAPSKGAAARAATPKSAPPKKPAVAGRAGIRAQRKS